MKLTGYTDRWSVQRGETLRVFVSCASSRFDVQLVRLIHGDENPRGPGFKSTPVPSPVEGSYPGESQAIQTGSYVLIDSRGEALGAEGFTVVLWLQATAPHQGEQGIVTQWDVERRRGFGLFIDGKGNLSGRAALTSGEVCSVTSRRTLRPQAWYQVALAYDPKHGNLTLLTQDMHPTVFDPPAEAVVAHLDSPVAWASDRPLLLAAGGLVSSDAGRTHATGCFNGKLSAPGVLARPLTAAELPGLSTGQLPVDGWLARWDLSHDPARRRIPDTSGHGYHGRTVNRPTRAVTGHNWTARTDSFREAPEQYNAIHFHDDDLEDAGWKESLRLVVPQELRSGVYALRLSTADGECDYLPFFVRTPTGKPDAAIAVLMPTVSYLAYSNEALDLEPFEFLAPLCPLRNMGLQAQAYEYIERLWLKSTYNHHRDGSGICHVTMLRPSLTSMRPTHRARLYDGPHQLSADLHLIDWLEEKQIPYDVICDHDLHREG
ncbi:MAG TPA: N,N-dimethylformamidase beta subunit family domain-containing protein, partial [Steroidobacteraceae bacterium]|nr:N,N-dimethylformamidase beta subunit family domain-containing protein [Steroidobacteraceae bacterium]